MVYSTTKFYNRIAGFYPLVDLFLKGHKKKLIDLINTEPAGHLLEIGVGNGSHLPLYKNHRITAIDTSEAMLKRAAMFGNDQVELLLMNGESLTFSSSSFDYVVMCHVLAVVKNPVSLLNEVSRVLKPGARLYILNHFTPGNWIGKIDGLFQPILQVLHFKSKFRLEDIAGLAQFNLVRSINIGIGSYFKLIIFEKP